MHDTSTGTGLSREPLILPDKKKGYKHSIDPFLIADFVSAKKEMKLAADFCTGNGIIAMLLAKKYPLLNVRGFELQWNLAREAGRVVKRNSLTKRVSMVCGDLTTALNLILPCAFDLVVGNPPYRRGYDGRVNPDPEKAIARHEIKITLKKFLKACSHALKERGRVFLIYHPYRLVELFEGMQQNQLMPFRIRFVHSFSGKEAQMVMVEGVKKGKNDLKVDAPLIIYEKEDLYTKEILCMYRKFGCQEGSVNNV